jgi:hypothetical protein
MRLLALAKFVYRFTFIILQIGLILEVITREAKHNSYLRSIALLSLRKHKSDEKRSCKPYSK